MAEADGNRTRQRRGTPLSGFEDRRVIMAPAEPCKSQRSVPRSRCPAGEIQAVLCGHHAGSFRQALEAGITFWDTANVYQHGTSEELVGRAVKRYSRREDIVLATKVFGKMHDGPGGQGLSRKAILEQVDASLTRLGTDYVDLY
jgi:predicted oxidoreductase